MRARKQLVVLALALPLTAGVAACGSEAQQTADTAQTCLEATRIANFTPNWNDAEQAKTEAQQKADEVAGLAEQAGDATIREHLTNVQNSLQKVADGQVKAEETGAWIQEQYRNYEALTAACTGGG
ncbi:hypothetical protein GIY23_19595 [Allosaccharopolyspora coralli]|uniref:Uncharacterized protein n=1 Tax=Allosaccharopolyspora coralli TaxID=2665642 RepID=A0A5Q3QC13_9PSEU|nr:hypothetical protein [Allosaccharopolyspora coralli]QGK71420.1 hypothetical protein GIY23_19595 [Allosaccharopolyspora coralli]